MQVSFVGRLSRPWPVGVTATRTISVRDRRRALVARHRLAGGAESPEAVVRALVALHATDPASVYLSVLARSTGSTLADVATAMYEQRKLVRWMAMRRTLFVFAREDIPMVQAAVSTELLGGWAYGAIYRSSTERTAALDGWLYHYNHHRKHSALGHQPPIARLNERNQP
jgi:transposase InsO family protein